MIDEYLFKKKKNKDEILRKKYIYQRHFQLSFDIFLIKWTRKLVNNLLTV